MSDDQFNQPGDQGTPQEQRPGGPDAFEEMPIEAPRRASLTLRADDVREQRAASMEAANQSLADALRITYRLILVLMVALVFVFIFTGVKQVNESEVGLKVTFGKITDRDLQPGAHFNLPFPLGEILSVSQSQKTVKVDRAFVFVGYNPTQSLDTQGGGSITLRPGIDGSLITADGSLVHARLSAGYRITDADLYLENLNPDIETDLLRSIVERATVQVVATVTIDELLSRATGGAAENAEIGAAAPAPARAGSIEQRIRVIAQDAIDKLNVGIQFSEVSLTSIFPPLRVRDDFQNVNRVDSDASKSREEAEETRRRRLNSVAGSAYRPLLDLIDKYEALLNAGDQDTAEPVLQDIFGVFRGERNGRNIKIGEKTYADVIFAGRAAEQISNAGRTRQVVVDTAKRRAALYKAKLEQYHANPLAFLAREWSEAMRQFLGNPQVQSFFAPTPSDFILQLNNDPDVVREIQRERQKRLTEQLLRSKGELQR